MVRSDALSVALGQGLIQSSSWWEPEYSPSSYCDLSRQQHAVVILAGAASSHISHQSNNTAAFAGAATASAAPEQDGAAEATNEITAAPELAGYRDPEPPGVSSNDQMQLLWQWKCELTDGRNVSCLAWNHHRHDLAAVGYGSFKFGEQQDGMVCIWSMKNPSYPLWWLKVASGVTSLDFSKAAGVTSLTKAALLVATVL